MIPIPADENLTDWICECEESYLYFPTTNSCHEAYKQGPCPPENYLVLLPGEELAKCEKNPCLQDGLVFFEGSCVSLNNPCENSEIKKYLRVDKSDFQLRCLEVGFSPRVNAPPKECAKGSRRNSLGICKRIFE